MLQAIRDGTKGWIAYVIVGVLAVPFALFGVYNYFTGGSDPTVAEVDGQEITAQQLDQAVQQQRQRLQSMLGDQYDPAMFDGGVLRRQALDQLIDTAVVDAYADSEGLRLTDAGLRRQIGSQKAFQVDGTFSPDRYRALLQRNNMTPQQYETKLRRQAAASQFQRAVAGSVLITDAELQRFVGLRRQQRQIAWLRLPVTAFTGSFDPDEATLKTYYKQHSSQWKRPQAVKLAYVELSAKTLQGAVDVDEKAVKTRYEKLKDTRFTHGGERQVRHILFQVPEEAGDQKVAAVREKATDVRQQIVSGKLEFARAASEYSDDASSAKDGGNLGWIGRGDLPAPLEKATFALESGKVSQPVRSDFGWHLVDVTGVRKQKVDSFEAVRDKLRNEMAAANVDDRFYELSNQLANVAYENPKSLKPAAKAVGVDVRTTDWMTRDGGASEGVTSKQAVLDAAFSDDVLSKGLNSQLIKLGEDRAVIVRVADERPAKTLSFNEVKDDVRKRWIAAKGADAARQRGEALQKKLAAGAKPSALAADGPATYQDFAWVGRDSDAPPAPVRDFVFRMPHPKKEGSPELGGMRLTNGDYAVIILHGVRDGKLADVPEDQREQLRRSLKRLDATSASQAAVAALRAQADVTINENRL